MSGDVDQQQARDALMNLIESGGEQIERLRAVITAAIRAKEAYRDAINGLGHPGEPHNRDLWHSMGGDMEIYSPVGDCSACGGAQYGCEDGVEVAFDALYDAVGLPRPTFRPPLLVEDVPHG